MVDIRINPIYVKEISCDATEIPGIVTPGQEICSESTFMTGHGTYVRNERICSSVVGIVDSISRLHSTIPISSKYNGEVGDVVVGRIMMIESNRWLVEVNARLLAVLHLSNLHLPGGERRVKSIKDEEKMRKFIAEGDLICAEVHSIYEDGALCLHTRNLKYGKLKQGTLIKVPHNLVEKAKMHFYNIVDGIQVILSSNGYIWIEPTSNIDAEHSSNVDDVSIEDRTLIARLRNCIKLLASKYHMLSETKIHYAYEASLIYPPKELLRPEVIDEIYNEVVQKCELEESGMTMRD